MAKTAERRFLTKLSFATTCVVWTGSKSVNGYGKFWDGGKMVSAHRFSFETYVGPIPDGHDLHHTCGVRTCVTPWHLEPLDHGTHGRVPKREFIRPNSLKTHCPEGHPYSPENTYVTKRGERMCRACGAAKKRAERRSRRGPTFGVRSNSLKTHCPRGHPYDVRQADGRRTCSVCKNEQKRARRADRRG